MDRSAAAAVTSSAQHTPHSVLFRSRSAATAAAATAHSTAPLLFSPPLTSFPLAFPSRPPTHELRVVSLSALSACGPRAPHMHTCCDARASPTLALALAARGRPPAGAATAMPMMAAGLQRPGRPRKDANAQPPRARVHAGACTPAWRPGPTRRPKACNKPLYKAACATC